MEIEDRETVPADVAGVDEAGVDDAQAVASGGPDDETSGSPAGTEGSAGSPPYPDGLEEATVVGRAQDGDLEAFELIVRRYQGPVFRLAYRMLGDRGEAEDVVQDCLVLVWRKLPTLTDVVAFRRWVYQLATRRCLSVLRTRTRRATDATDADALERDLPVDDADDPARMAQYAAQLRGLDTFLRQLPDEQRACWVLRELHDLTYTEIAFAMNLPVSTVRGRLARARQNLTEGMSAWR
ncbi:RNA polymerase sigma factor [Microlunatus capsulatus]|uniref:RNA polymerase sigma-70 factor (ECF subfamily) n=1 Tax=Microlunatus capsulatus TaxID=99117 RepID=A0ABS4ZA98_9ACTN|nr:RNA polymerase sigma factor [Microlunatus capsulatus]MBP2417642.1 RNA polymerase sigma-70 factor (ECF subfamily) [Microlunatus capsulatus]